MVSRKTSLLMSAPLVILCTAGARPAAADEAPPPPAPAAAAQEPMLLEEIIVTAEKQASGRPLQIVPIAITAIDASTIQESHAQSIVDIGHMAPNVVLDASGTLLGTAAFTIRGVGERSSTASIDPAVAVTQDGMPLSLQTGLSLLGTFDTENIQILRGPQGVLQGVGAAGGAVTFTTPCPPTRSMRIPRSPRAISTRSVPRRPSAARSPTRYSVRSPSTSSAPPATTTIRLTKAHTSSRKKTPRAWSPSMRPAWSAGPR
jgi:outer membrane cobalamin receptor